MAYTRTVEQGVSCFRRQGGPHAESPWLPGFPNHADGKPRLFCFPFAGGSGEYYRSWQTELGELAAVCPVELPGRGSRSSEPFAASITRMAREIALVILSIGGGPFVFFGHSLGAMLGIETALALKRLEGCLPRLFLASGLPPPHTGLVRPPDPDSPEALLKDVIRGFGGTPASVLDEPELAAYFLPIFRSDFRLAHEYVPSCAEPLDMVITALAGVDDPDTPEADVARWGEMSGHPLRLHLFSGGHFFLEERRRAVLRVVANEITSSFSR